MKMAGLDIKNFRRSLIISRGSWWVFPERPICLDLLALSLLFLLMVLLPAIRQGPKEAFKEG
jgi:TctA family transporter